ncbi:hypothetical protein EVAR_84945_1 [Eumeta japonica]|uniref:Uncharacterized protein n=1 Tax=Eumeta variegata TaxID=151549 RepID=A0A4C1VFR1_EUMVA|nr:hypothetical protein EVAR_84945_1 [Eumeta japonica]
MIIDVAKKKRVTARARGARVRPRRSRSPLRPRTLPKLYYVRFNDYLQTLDAIDFQNNVVFKATRHSPRSSRPSVSRRRPAAVCLAGRALGACAPPLDIARPTADSSSPPPRPPLRNRLRRHRISISMVMIMRKRRFSSIPAK